MLAALATSRDRPRDGPEPAATNPCEAAVDTGDREPIASVDEIEIAFLRHAQVLQRYLYARTGRVQDAEDLLGDVFVQACRYRGRIAQLDHWLFTVARHSASRLLGHRGREIPVEDVEAVENRDGASGGLESGADALRQGGFDPAAPEIIALRALSDADRDILMLHGLAQRPMPEVALILAVSEAAAWQRWQRARDRYCAHLVAVGVHPPGGWRKPRRAGSGGAFQPAADAAPARHDDAQTPASHKDAQHDV